MKQVTTILKNNLEDNTHSQRTFQGHGGGRQWERKEATNQTN